MVALTFSARFPCAILLWNDICETSEYIFYSPCAVAAFCVLQFSDRRLDKTFLRQSHRAAPVAHEATGARFVLLSLATQSSMNG